MKRVFHLLMVALSAALMFACSPEERKDLVNQIISNDGQNGDGGTSGGSQDSGMPVTPTGTYAFDDGTGLTTRYLSFSNEKFYDFRLKEGLDAVVNADGYLWHGSFADFESVNSGDFSIQDGQLICAGVPYGAITVKTNEITLEGEKFSKFGSFKSAWYTTLTISGNEENYSYSQQTVEWTVSLDKTVPASIPVATSDSDWMSNFAIEDGKLSFLLSENNTGNAREGQVSVTCPGAEDITISFTQNYVSSEILLEKTSLETDYQGGEFSFTYRIDNPREGATLSAVSQSNWITDVVIGDGYISYKVAENHSVRTRTGSIRLFYGMSEATYDSKGFIVEQGDEPIQLSLNKSTLELHPGEIEALIPTVSPTDAILLWTSDNEDVISVNYSGRVSALANGQANITLKALRQFDSEAGSKTVVCKVAVTTAVTGISLNCKNLILPLSQTEQLIPDILPISASNKEVTWKSSDNDIATVNEEGLVTANAIGTATITACTVDGKFIASCVIITPSIVDLSSSGTANCYIVPDTGTYSFKAVKGTSPYNTITSIASVEVLWESFGTSSVPNVGDIIAHVSYADRLISFSTPSSLRFNNGNAVIAALNSSGKTLWSWHIWVCKDYDPITTAQEYFNDTGTMMDRNLGATSATPGDVGALGLLYQWGRKDPFLGSCSISSEKVIAASTLGSWPSPVTSDSSVGTINYSVANPTTFIDYNAKNHDWYYTGSSSTDNNRWKSAKSAYDPCPPGWRVPDGGNDGIWSKVMGSSTDNYPPDENNKGMNFSGKLGSANNIWYPKAGYLRSINGRQDLMYTSIIGQWWSCTAVDSYAYAFNIQNGYYSPKYGLSCFYGLSVRCQKE